jgi:hypothetical protein
MPRFTPSSSSALRAAAVPWLLLAAPASGTAAVHSVRPDGLGDYSTIQAAVDSASAGDEIVLEDGVFTGPGNRDIGFAGKDLVVRSRNGAAACTIDSQGTVTENHRAFRLDGGETAASRIEGITITGGFVEGPFPESGGGGILVADGSHPVIADCVFDGNVAGYHGFGAGLLAWNGCNITLTDCAFRNGSSGWYGGGFTLRLHCDALVERCTVTDNWSGHAGGGASITRSDAIVNDCLFANNVTTEVDGGGVLIKAEARPVFSRCVFAGNTAWTGGAVGLGNLPEVTMIDCLFEGNRGVGQGGALDLDQEPSVLHLIRCTLTNNHAPYFGGHAYVGAFATLTARNCIFGEYCEGASAVYVAPSAYAVDIDCSVFPGGLSEIAGAGPVIWGTDNVDADPGFCAPAAACSAPAWPSGDYTLDSLSPAAPSWSPCGLMGAYPVACGVTSAGAGLELRSWGRMKAAYRTGPAAVPR